MTCLAGWPKVHFLLLVSVLIGLILFAEETAPKELPQEFSRPAEEQKIPLALVMQSMRNSPRNTAWQLYHYQPKVLITNQEAIDYLRITEKTYWRELETREIEKSLKYPFRIQNRLQGDIGSAVMFLMFYPSPETLAELKRVIEDEKLPKPVRAQAVAIYGVIGGDINYLKKLTHHDLDKIQEAAAGAYVIRLTATQEKKPLIDYDKALSEEYEQGNQEKGPRLGNALTNILFGPMKLIQDYWKTESSYEERIIFLFDQILVPYDAFPLGDEVFSYFALREFTRLYNQAPNKAAVIVQNHVNNLKDHRRAWAVETQRDLGLPMLESDRLETEKIFGPMKNWPRLRIPGIPLIEPNK